MSPLHKERASDQYAFEVTSVGCLGPLSIIDVYNKSSATYKS